MQMQLGTKAPPPPLVAAQSLGEEKGNKRRVSRERLNGNWSAEFMGATILSAAEGRGENQGNRSDRGGRQSADFEQNSALFGERSSAASGDKREGKCVVRWGEGRALSNGKTPRGDQSGWEDNNAKRLFVRRLMAAQLASALSSPDYYNCQMQPGLTRRQREVCVRHPATMRAISDGLRDAIDACHAQFERDRWNCSATFGMGAPARGVATAETAFIFAISSGGASHAVARACSRGAIPECGCGGGEHTVVMGPPDGISADPQQFIWAGCSDNVRYGNQFTRKFIDAAEKQRTDARSLMNLHNNRVGRKLLAANMRKQCKCHGVSGSCVTKTCWRTVPKMEELAGILKRKYARAQQVTMASDSAALVLPSPSPATAAPYSMAQAASSRSGRFLKDRVRFEPAQLANRAELVYLEASPDYCDMDASGERMSGTSGRECFSQQECEQLCCGRGWDTRREVRQEPCRCKFVWCCDVKCDTCRREVERRFCR